MQMHGIFDGTHNGRAVVIGAGVGGLAALRPCFDPGARCAAARHAGAPRHPAGPARAWPARRGAGRAAVAAA